MDQKVESLGRKILRGLMYPSVHTKGLPALSYILFYGFHADFSDTHGLAHIIRCIYRMRYKKNSTSGKKKKISKALIRFHSVNKINNYQRGGGKWGKKSKIIYSQFTSVQSPSHLRLFVTPWAAASQAFLSITDSQSYPNSCPLSR